MGNEHPKGVSPTEVAADEARGYKVEEPAKSFRPEFPGCRPMEPEEWDILVALHSSHRRRADPAGADHVLQSSTDPEQSMTVSVNLLQHLQLLGLRVEDRVTGFKGVAASVTFDLYGCIQAIVNPGAGADGKLQDSQWFDVNRLRVIDTTPVMERPHFEWTPEATSVGAKGAAERPRTMKA